MSFWAQINLAHVGPIGPGNGGPPDPEPPAIIIDQLVKHFDYDGLGRLIRTESPYPDPQSSNGQTRTERFYYDGIRRVQELVTDPLITQDDAANSPNPLLAQAAQQSAPNDPDADGTATTLGLEQKIQDDPQLLGSAPQTYTYLAREYIWGPGDGPGGVDELLCQYASDRSKPWWTLQDAGGDIVAICDQPSPGYSARVDAQYTYDAYGAANTAEHLVAHPYLHAGHKALFNDRLDVGTAPSIGGGESPRLWPYAHAVYQVRNRAYSPALGRFLQRDPNAAALNLIEATAYHGRGLSAIIAAFSMEDRYGDGGNLYQYLGSNPWHRHDLLGMSWDPFDMVDEFMAEHSASVAAWMNEIGNGLNGAGMIAATIVSYLPFPGAALVGDLAAAILNGEDLSDVLVGHAIGLVPGGKLLGFLGSLAVNYIELNTDQNRSEDEWAEDDDGEGGPAMARARAPGYMNSTTATHYVYVIRAGDHPRGRVTYVGITTDTVARSRQHGSQCQKICNQKFTERQARSMESALMTKFPGAKCTGGSGSVQIRPGLRNRRLSIGWKHQFFRSALQDGITLLRDFAPDILQQIP